MKYYKLQGSIDNKIIGKYPQSEECKIYGDIYNLDYSNILKTLNNIPEPIVEKKSKITDYLSCAPINNLIFLILKKEVISFLEDFSVPNFKTWNTKVHYKNESINNYCLFFIIDSWEEKFIHFEKSEFLIGKLGDWKDPSIRKKVDINYFTDYIDLQSKLNNSNDNSQIRCNKLVLNLKNTKEDIFRLSNMPYFGAGYYVSERLKEAIEENGFTGMDFKEIPDVDSRIEVIY